MSEQQIRTLIKTALPLAVEIAVLIIRAVQDAKSKA